MSEDWRERLLGEEWWKGICADEGWWPSSSGRIEMRFTPKWETMASNDEWGNEQAAEYVAKRAETSAVHAEVWRRYTLWRLLK